MTDLSTPIYVPSPPNMGRTVIHHDPRSKNFRAFSLIPKTDASIKDKVWRRGQAYDQGYTSTCVAQTGKGMLNSLPMSSQIDYDERSKYDIWKFYYGAQGLDEWPGEDYDGTSALGLCKFLTQVGLIKEYRWCFDLYDVLLSICHTGPVGLGVWWYSGMFETNSEGFIEPTGVREGGHEVELIGVDISEKCVIGMNSWGAGWGYKGRFKLSWGHLDRLLHEEGDAFVIIR